MSETLTRVKNNQNPVANPSENPKPNKEKKKTTLLSCKRTKDSIFTTETEFKRETHLNPLRTPSSNTLSMLESMKIMQKKESKNTNEGGGEVGCF